MEVREVEQPPPPPPEAPVVAADVGEEQAPPPAPPPPPTPPAPPQITAAGEDVTYNRARPPRYPPDALRRGVQGTVMVLVLVGPDGSVQEAKIRKGVHPSLDRAAMQAVQKWKFNPAVKDGVPYADWALVPVRFSLDG